MIPLLLVAGCGQPTGEGPQTYTADWAGMVAFTDDHCASCHAPDAGNPVTLPDDLVADVLAGTRAYVVPHEPEASRLWRVVEGSLLEGDYAVMPLGSGPLPPETTAHVREWILAGAPLDGACDTPWFADGDGDGFGSGDAVTACIAPEGHVARGDDCDDADPDTRPGAPETCDDPVDRNCDGATGRVDGDGDGFFACEECDDTDPDATIAEDWYVDADGDGFGAGPAVASCEPLDGHAQVAGDCDDASATTHPDVPVDGANGADDDCDGAVDEDGDLPSYAADVEPIFAARCVQCHGPPTPSGDLDLETAGWSALVDAPSGQAPLDLVEPFDPDRSYLWHKLNGTQRSVGGSGSSMPKAGETGGRPLTDDQLATIEAWIAAGAAP